MSAAIITSLAWLPILALAVVAIIAQRREIDRQTDRANKSAGDAWRYQLALVGIKLATHGGKSGTARKVNRMAWDAVGERDEVQP
jgi:hypothetical protein